MGVTANTMIVGSSSRNKLYWSASVYSGDASGTEVIKAAPSSGNLYLESLKILVDADCVTILIYDGVDILIGPFEVSAGETGGVYTFDFLRPIKLTGALQIDQGTG